MDMSSLMKIQNNNSTQSPNDNRTINRNSNNHCNNSNSQITYSLNTSLNTDTLKILNFLKTPNNTANKPKANSTSNTIKEYSYDDIKRICMKVFMFYAMPKNGQFFLSYQNLFRILRSGNVVNNDTFMEKDADIIAQKIVKGVKPFTADNFLNFLAKIAPRVDSGEYNNNKDKKDVLIHFIKMHLEPIAMQIDSSCIGKEDSKENDREKDKDKDKDKDERSHNEELSSSLCNKTSLSNSIQFHKFVDSFILDQQVYLLLTSIAPSLKQIYLLYFVFETTRHHDLVKIEKASYNNFLTFCKDFEICPYLISHKLLVLYWGVIISSSLEQLINNTSIPFQKFNDAVYNIGTIYTFPKFMLLFAHISSYYYNTVDLNEGKRMLYLIEKIHESQGYKNLNKKSSVPFNRKHSIIPPKEIIMLLDASLLNDKDKNDFDSRSMNMTISMNDTKTKTKHKDWIDQLKEILSLNSDTFNFLEPFIDILKDYYRIYSQYGDKFNYAKMTFSNYQKMLIEGGLMEHSSKQYGNGNTNNTTMKSMNKVNSTANINAGNNNKSLTKNMSEPLYYNHQNNIGDDEDIINMTISRICLSLGKDKDILDEIDLNMIFSKIAGLINFSQHLKEHNRKVNFDGFHSLNMTESKSNMPNRLSFFLFIKSFIFIAKRLYPSNNDINEAMQLFLQNQLPKFLQRLEEKNASSPKEKEDLSNILISIDQNNEIKQLMKDITPLLQMHYQMYMDSHKMICFENLINFYKDYDIYPYWVTLGMMKDMYFTCIDKEVTLKGNCALNSSQYINVIKNEKLTFDSFLETIVVTGINMKVGDDLSWSDKILYLLDKMFVSEVLNSQKKTGLTFNHKKDFNYHERALMKKYPDYYQKKYGTVVRNIRMENELAFEQVFSK